MRTLQYRVPVLYISRVEAYFFGLRDAGIVENVETSSRIHNKWRDMKVTFADVSRKGNIEKTLRETYSTRLIRIR